MATLPNSIQGHLVWLWASTNCPLSINSNCGSAFGKAMKTSSLPLSIHYSLWSSHLIPHSQSKVLTEFFNKLRGNGKDTPVPLRHTGNGHKAPFILKLSGQPHASRPGIQWISCWPHSGAGLDVLKRKNLLSLPKIKLWIIQLTAQSLYWMSYPSSTCI